MCNCKSNCLTIILSLLGGAAVALLYAFAGIAMPIASAFGIVFALIAFFTAIWAVVRTTCCKPNPAQPAICCAAVRILIGAALTFLAGLLGVSLIGIVTTTIMGILIFVAAAAFFFTLLMLISLVAGILQGEC